MTDHIETIRKALAAGPTPGEWKTSRYGAFNTEIRSQSGRRTAATWVQCPAKSREGALNQAKVNEANAAFIAACNPVAIAALLVELDYLRAANRLLEKQRNDADTYGDEQYAIAERLRSELKEAFGEGK